MRYDDMIDYSKLSATEMIEHINLDYYKQEIEEIDQEIFNIRTGRPKFDGIYGTRGSVYTDQKEKDREIKSLEARKEKLKKQMKQYNIFVVEAHRSLRNLDGIARERALLELFDSAMDDVLKPFGYKSVAWVDTETNKKYGKKIFKLISKDRSKVYKESDKINKKMYKALKKFSKKMSLKKWNTGIGLGDAIVESKHSIDTLFSSALWEMRNEYYKDPSSLGVNEESLERATKLMSKNDKNLNVSILYARDSLEKIKELNKLQKLSLSSSLFNQVNKLLSSYESILQLAREVEALHCVIEAFKNTTIKESSGYQYIKEVYNEQDKRLNNLLNEADKKYKEYDVLVEMNKKLEGLYHDYLFEKMNLARLEESNESYSKISEQRRKVDDIRYEMLGILVRYPELNKSEYGIDLKNIKDEHKKMDEERKTGEKGKNSNDKTGPNIGVSLSSILKGFRKKGSVEEVVPETQTVQIPIEEPKVIIEPSDSNTSKTELTEDEKLRQEIEMPDNLVGLNVDFYQRYMKYKRLNPDNKNMKYWEYLEEFHPNLVDLIAIEKAKEERVETVFKKYIKYVASCGGKKNAMSFKDYAKTYYNVESYDISQEYEERARKL